MSRSTAQPLTVSIAVDQTVDISNPVEGHSTPQPLTVTLGTDYIYVPINPAMTIPKE